MKKKLYKNAKVTLFGLGRYPKGSSFASAEFLSGKGARVTVVDDKSPKELAALSMWRKKLPGLTYKLGKYLIEDFTEADFIVRNPSVLDSHPMLKKAHQAGVPIYTDISLFFEMWPRVDVGITGTRGKSTTSALVASILEQHYRSVFLGGNISVSPLSFIDTLRSNSKVVLELSSYLTDSLKMIQQGPHVSCITNLYKDHLNVHKSYKEYVDAKSEIYKYQKKADSCILNASDKEVAALKKYVPSGIIWFSYAKPRLRGQAVFVDGENIVYRSGSRTQKVLPLSSVQLPGKHNIENVCAAVAIAKALKIPNTAIARGVKKFRGLPQRLEFVGNKHGRAFYNDSTSTIPEATERALQSFDEKVTLIFGGNDKKLDFTRAGKVIRAHARHTYLLPGTARMKIARALRSAGATYTITANLKDAFQKAVHKDKSGVILFSPGASSFHEFDNEFKRGDAFSALYEKL